MKKILGLFIASIFIATRAYAGIITVQAFSADSNVAHLENFRTVVVNAINGNIQGSGTNSSTTNILADSLGELDMADEINPRVRDSELLSVTTDSTTNQATYVYTGLTPATDATLTSNISTGTAYINGYRVNKSATAHTYTASKDTYVDLSQTGAFTYSAVVLGAAAPTVAANSARLAKVTTSGTAITTVTDLANRRLPGLLVPTNYRSGMIVSRDSATTITVAAGTVEINNAMVSKTSTTTLTLNTAGDWAGGSSLQAVSTYGYVGIDASGNLKMHTTKPAFDNYSLTTTTGKLRYASWSSTTYRILGWFWMNATGSGQLNTYGVSNIKEFGIENKIVVKDTTDTSTSSTSYVNGTPTDINFYCDKHKIDADAMFTVYQGGNGEYGAVSLSIAGVDQILEEAHFQANSSVPLTGARAKQRIRWTSTVTNDTTAIIPRLHADNGAYTTHIAGTFMTVQEID